MIHSSKEYPYGTCTCYCTNSAGVCIHCGKRKGSNKNQHDTVAYDTPRGSSDAK